MATFITSSVANTEGFIPSIWAQEALEILRNNIVLARVCAKDNDFGEGAFANVGQTLTIGYAGTFTPQAKTANTLLTASVPTGGSSASVTLNQYQVVPFVIENLAQAQSNQNLMQRLLEPAVVALAEKVEADLFATSFAFSRPSQGTVGTGLNAAALQQAAKTLNIAKAPQSDRHIIVSPGDLASLEADSTLQNYFAFNASNGVVEDGEFSRPIYGLNLHMSQLVPQLGNAQTYDGGLYGGTNSVWAVTVGAASAGTFTLTYGGQTTGGIAYNATANAVEAALQALSSVGVGQARVSGTGAVATPYIVTIFLPSPTALTGNGAGLTGGSFGVAAAANSVTPNANLSFHKNAILLATRPVRPAGGSTVMSAMIQDEESGLVLNMEAQYNIQAMGLWVNLSILYGVVALRPDQAQVTLS